MERLHHRRARIASAEISNTMSGNINIITKSGSNVFHGSLFWLNNVEDLNARNQFLKTRPGLTFNQFGGSFGGGFSGGGGGGGGGGGR